MKIAYDDNQEIYLVKIEETTIWINTNDIVKAREEFIEHITKKFNDAVCEQLKDSF